MKKKYEKPELEFVGFEYKNVCATSGSPGTGGDEDWDNSSNDAATNIRMVPLNSIFGDISADTSEIPEDWSLETESEE